MQWRPSAHPPENGSHCLVARINYIGKPFHTYYLAIWDVWRGDNGRFTRGWWHEHEAKLLDNVTHWMPLPDPPNQLLDGKAVNDERKTD